MGFAFSRKSLIRADGVDKDLLKIAMKAISYSPVDMTITWRGGLRTAEQQKELFDAGNTRCDGYVKRSYHQSGKALDIVPWYKGKVDYKATDRFQEFAILMFATFEFLQAIGQIRQNVYLHWGGFWSARDYNGDGYLHHTDDKFGWDQPHWEFRSRPQKNVLKFLK